MPSNSPINGFEIPLLSDATPTVEDMVQWAVDLDTQAFTRVATLSARDAIYPTGMPEGSVIYVEETHEFYRDFGDGSWISWLPRRFVLTESKAVAGDHPLLPAALFTVNFEANSRYQVRGLIDFLVPADDLVLGWTFTQPIDVGTFVISYDDTEVWGIDFAQVHAESNDRRLEWIKWCRISTNSATVGTLNAYKLSDVGADGTINPFGTFIEVWKTGGD